MTIFRINNDTEGVIGDVEAVEYVSKVIQQGLISDDGKCYCYCTVFTHSDSLYVPVYCRQTKTGYTFTLHTRKIE